LIPGKEVIKMLKILVIDRCKFCDGEAYVFVGESEDADGVKHPVYLPCHVCKGSGETEKQVTLREFADLLERAIAFEPNYAELAKQNPVTNYRDSRDAAGQ
jgi:hypothetical protein